MKFLVDESIEFPVVTFLRSIGHDVVSVAEDFPSVCDTDVLAAARRAKRILLTNDKDFGELIFLHGLPHQGVILLRLFEEDAQSKIDRLRVLLETHGDDFSGSFTVVSPDAVRIRRTRSVS